MNHNPILFHADPPKPINKLVREDFAGDVDVLKVDTTTKLPIELMIVDTVTAVDVDDCENHPLPKEK